MSLIFLWPCVYCFYWQTKMKCTHVDQMNQTFPCPCVPTNPLSKRSFWTSAFLKPCTATQIVCDTCYGVCTSGPSQTLLSLVQPQWTASAPCEWLALNEQPSAFLPLPAYSNSALSLFFSIPSQPLLGSSVPWSHPDSSEKNSNIWIQNVNFTASNMVSQLVL